MWDTSALIKGAQESDMGKRLLDNNLKYRTNIINLMAEIRVSVYINIAHTEHLGFFQFMYTFALYFKNPFINHWMIQSRLIYTIYQEYRNMDKGWEKIREK